MKALLILSTIVASSMAMAAGPAAAPAANPVEKTVANSEGQVAAIVLAANEAEVKAGQSAQAKAQSADVKAFAKHMVEEHTANTKQQTDLAKKLGVTPEDTPKVANLKADSERQLGEVNSHTGAAFDKAYIENQITMHAMVLTSIDRELLPATKNAQMKAFLETTKTHVQQHLAEAKKIQSKLK